MDVKDQIRRYIVDRMLMGAGPAPADDASLLDQGVLDSIGALELVAFLKETFGIAVADEEMVPDNLDSVNGIAAFVDRKRAGR